MRESDTTLRDHLAVERTRLANERTILSYARTSLMLIASGATLWRLGSLGASDRVLGGVAIAAGVAVAAIGWRRFEKTKRRLDRETTPPA
jgi:putative membrane protein